MFEQSGSLSVLGGGAESINRRSTEDSALLLETATPAVDAASESLQTTHTSDSAAYGDTVQQWPGDSPAAVDSERLLRSTTANFATWSRRYVRVQVLADVLVGATATAVGAAIAVNLPVAGGTAVLALVGGVAWAIAVALGKGYDPSTIGVGGDELRAIFRAAALTLAVVALPSGILNTAAALTMMVISTPLAVLCSLAARFAARKWLHHQQREGRAVRRVILVGGVYSTIELAQTLEHESHAGMQVVGVCVPDADRSIALSAGLDVIGSLAEVPALTRKYAADAVAVTGGDATRQNYLRQLSWDLEGEAVELFVHPGLVEVAGPRMHIRPYVGLPLLQIEQPHFTGWRRFVKRATDVVLTGLGLVVISPLLAGIALAIKLSDGGPVFFRQTRVGLDGSRFTMWKFRSMRVDAEARLAALREANPEIGLMFKMTDDPRITKVGKFIRKYSLDELPQLFNVMGGTMSLVGPRPPLPAEVEAYEDDARRRLLVTPGLTGLWQVSGRSLLSWEETVRLDLRYVENWTLTFDLLILWKTFFAVAAKRGAF